MVSATLWRQDTALQPTNPYQRVRFFSTFPSGGQGDSAFAWSPVTSSDPAVRGYTPVGAPTGFMPTPGLSGGLGLFDLKASAGKIVLGFVGVGGILFGAWLAKKNLG